MIRHIMVSNIFQCCGGTSSYEAWSGLICKFAQGVNKGQSVLIPRILLDSKSCQRLSLCHETSIPKQIIFCFDN